MAVASNIARSDVAGLIPTDYSNQLLDVIVAESVALSIFPRISLGTSITKLPVLSALPSAGFVSENTADATGVKPKSKVQWSDKTITAEEVAVIIPVHENVLEDSTIDLWASITPLVGQAFGQVIDGAIFFGTNKPTSWREGLIPTAKTAGNNASYTGTANGSAGDLMDKFNDLFKYVEKDGNSVTDVVAGPRFKGKLRGLRETTGGMLLGDVATGTDGRDLYGASVAYMRNGVWSDALALAAAVDRTKVVVGIRSDMSYKVLDQATLGTGTDALNLAERDMVALRVKMRLGWELADNTTALAATPTCVSVLTATAGNS